jgi:hypothetical protein
LTIEGLSEKTHLMKGGEKMNPVIKSCFVILVVFALSASAYAIDPSSILVYWPCDEGQGGIVKDMSGNDRDGQWRDGVTDPFDGEWTEGKFGLALDFSGRNYCVVYETDDDPDLRAAAGSVPFTVAYYVKTTVDTGKGRTVDMGSHGCTNGWHSAVNAGKIILEISDRDTKAGGGCAHHWDHPVADGEWHHVAHSVIPGEVAHTYVDGVQNLEDFDLSAKGSIEPFEGRELDLGVSFRFDTEYFPGQLDEIVIINYALSEAEVNEIMATPLTAVELTGKATATWGAIKAGY